MTEIPAATVSFRTTMTQIGNNTGIEVPPEVLDALGAGKRPAVVVRVNGFEYRSTVGSMRGAAMIPFSSERRTQSGIAGRDEIDVELTVDAAPREIAVPDDLAEALASAGVRAAFDELAPSARRAHVTAVEGAKAEATRARRIGTIVAGLAPRAAR
ncbi:YdeI/OmpD-associated family protein [uncultured Microbacterium sp.]|jgi:Bacteriocin-protection, YdeI or OmpD-Associated/Domain of unknown function (DUF1905)|uniref:YdeI/OmpD-associated family protein n=1 Tax=uncultured Microbacterium sp. TaxID=191216 RepID=UPI0025D3B191|nr:YdeI/OmpD-associated family protein [uncultured Microbacterium sp.]